MSIICHLIENYCFAKVSHLKSLVQCLFASVVSLALGRREPLWVGQSHKGG